MLGEILKECIEDMIKDPTYLFTLSPDDIYIKSYSLKNLGKSRVYCCETDSPDKAFYVEQSRVKRKIEEKRNKRIDDVLDRQE